MVGKGVGGERREQLNGLFAHFISVCHGAKAAISLRSSTNDWDGKAE